MACENQPKFYAVHAQDSCPKHNCCVCEEPKEFPTKQGLCSAPDPLWSSRFEEKAPERAASCPILAGIVGSGED